MTITPASLPLPDAAQRIADPRKREAIARALIQGLRRREPRYLPGDIIDNALASWDGSTLTLAMPGDPHASCAIVCEPSSLIPENQSTDAQP